MLGNRLDRFNWDGTTLTYDKTLHRSRALQDDVTNRRTRQPRAAATTTAASCASGPDGKIYLIVGDTGRRGQTQNLVDGPFVVPVPERPTEATSATTSSAVRTPTPGISPA